MISLLLSCSGSEEGITRLSETENKQLESVRRKTLSWDTPTTNSDGAPLNDLAGFRIYYGTSEPLTKSNSTRIDVDGGPVITSFLLPKLNGTHYIAVTAVDINGNESDFSDSVIVLN